MAVLNMADMTQVLAATFRDKIEEQVSRMTAALNRDIFGNGGSDGRVHLHGPDPEYAWLPMQSTPGWQHYTVTTSYSAQASPVEPGAAIDPAGR